MSLRNTVVSGFKIDIFNQWFKLFPKIFLRQLNFTFIAKEKLHFSLNCSHCCLVKRDWALKVAQQFVTLGLVVYKLVAYKKTKRSKSIPGFSISRLVNVEDFFNVNVFFKYKYVTMNDYLFKYACVVCCLKIRFQCLTFCAMSNLNSVISQDQTSHQRL